MKKILALFLLLSLATILAAQSRARRVGQGSTTADQSGRAPVGPPVLHGANAPTKSQTSTPAAPSGPEEVEAGDVIRVNTTLVTIPVSVLDRDGRYVPNLNKGNFRLWEDEVEQDVAFFASVDKPFSVVLMLDTSGSTRFRLDEIQDAAIAFVNQLRPDDRVMVVSFDDDLRVLSEFTNDRYRLRDAIRHTRTGEGTRLYDAMDMVMNQRLTQISGRKAIVLFTDGVDTTSKHGSYASNVRDAEELDALIYPLQYDTYMDVNGGGPIWTGGRRRVPTSPIDILGQIFGGIGGGSRRSGGGSSRSEYQLADRYLRELAQRTGARGYQADSIQNLTVAFANIAEELRRQYSLGYYPKNPPQTGERRQIRVRVDQPNLAVRSRDSYVFNPSGSATQDAAAQQSRPILRRKLNESDRSVNP